MLDHKLRPLVLLLLMTLVLSACAGDGGVWSESEIAALYADGEGFDAAVSMVTNLGERMQEYEVFYEHRKEENDRLTVLSPEAVRGIAIGISSDDGGLTLHYGETMLETAMPDYVGLTPVDGVSHLVETLAGGYPTLLGKETVSGEATLHLTYEDEREDGLFRREVFLTGDGRLKAAEIYLDSVLILNMEFSDFEWTDGI